MTACRHQITSSAVRDLTNTAPAKHYYDHRLSLLRTTVQVPRLCGFESTVYAKVLSTINSDHGRGAAAVIYDLHGSGFDGALQGNGLIVHSAASIFAPLSKIQMVVRVSKKRHDSMRQSDNNTLSPPVGKCENEPITKPEAHAQAMLPSSASIAQMMVCWPAR